MGGAEGLDPGDAVVVLAPFVLIALGVLMGWLPSPAWRRGPMADRDQLRRQAAWHRDQAATIERYLDAGERSGQGVEHADAIA
jgi:hypothetical protein